MKIRIILADDHPVTRLGTRSIIESSKLGTIAGEAASSDELLELLQSTPCDVLVTDYSMPDSVRADGLPMINRIRRDYPHLPLVMLSMSRNPSILHAVRKTGVFSFVDKSASLEDLPLAIQSASRRRPFLSPSLRNFSEAAGAIQGRPRPPLSKSETEVLRHLAQGRSAGQIAKLLHKSISTISRQKSDAKQKLSLNTDMELFNYLRDAGL